METRTNGIIMGDDGFNRDDYDPSKHGSVTDYILLIREWAVARNLVEGATPQAQMLKLTEELGELAGGVARKNLDTVKDGIGDCVVVLTILAAQHGLTMRECIGHAYNEIKDRKGRMVDGIFVKEGDG